MMTINQMTKTSIVIMSFDFIKIDLDKCEKKHIILCV